MSISKIKSAEKLIRFGLENYYGEKVSSLECKKNTLLDESHELAIDHLKYHARTGKITPDMIDIVPSGHAYFSFEIPELREKIEEIDNTIEKLHEEYSEKLQLLENWVNYAIINDSNVIEAPSIPETLKPFYNIAISQFQED